MSSRADDLPVGIVTFLLSDIEGSTSLWEREPDLMRIALELHDAVMACALYVLVAIGWFIPDSRFEAKRAQLAGK